VSKSVDNTVRVWVVAGDVNSESDMGYTRTFTRKPRTLTEEDIATEELAVRKNEFLWQRIARLPRLSEYLQYKIDSVPNDDPFAQLLSELLTSTVQKHREVHQQLQSRKFTEPPRLYCDPPEFEVIRVRSIVNPVLQRLYLAKLEELEGKWRSGCTVIEPLAHLKLPQATGDIDLNEHLLFYGAPAGAVETICKSGFKPQQYQATGNGKLCSNAFPFFLRKFVERRWHDRSTFFSSFAKYATNAHCRTCGAR